jgi:hypothetical protein
LYYVTGLSLKTYVILQGLHEERVNARMPLWIAPFFLLPASTPDWASAANTRNFIDVPFDGFLAPPSEIAALTRILRHPQRIENIIA